MVSRAVRHGLPAFVVDLPGAAVWSAAVAVLCTVAACVALVWLAAAIDRLGSPWALAGGGAAAAALILAGRSAHQQPCRLAWDGQQWQRQAGASPAEPGALALMLDLGGWMLLHFDAGVPGGAAPRRHWLAVSRKAVGAAWHPLRCAVYSARPAPGASSAAVVSASDA